MKKVSFTTTLLLIGLISFEQQWAGSTTINNDLYRNGNVSIGTTTGGIPINVYQSVALGLPLNSSSIIERLGGLTGPNANANKFYSSVWLRKVTANDNSWYGTALHEGISIDGSYGVPGSTTKTWWERNPSDITQSWGDLTNTYMTLNGSYLGIGTTTPSSNLNIDPKGTGGILIGNSNTSTGSYTNLSLRISAQTNGYAALQCTKATGSAYGNITLNASGGNVLIGKTTQTNTGYLLDVAGSVRANRVVVNTTGADFVFEPGYKLASLTYVESYIKQNKHLPEINAASTMQANGEDIGDLNTKLLQKVEELTLYVIQLQKQVDALNAKK